MDSRRLPAGNDSPGRKGPAPVPSSTPTPRGPGRANGREGNEELIGSERGDGVRRLERAVAVAQQERDVCAVEMGDRHVELTVAVEVADRDRLREVAGGVEVHRRLERAVAVSQQHADG